MKLLVYTGQGLGPAQDHSQPFWRDQKELTPLLYMCSAPLALLQGCCVQTLYC